MKKLSLVLVMLCFACTSFAQMTKDQIVAEWQRAKKYTQAYLDAMPADGYTFKPTPEVRSFAGQMLHLANANYFFLSTIAGKPVDMKNDLEKNTQPTKEAVTKAVNDSYDFAVNAIQGMTEDQFKQEVSMGKIKTTKGVLLAKAFEHQTHHRGQTTPYLRLKGVTPPNEMLF
ncbi:damage-inducible protein DinB [Mucilaginibacter achroorhodeus]|uniref:Damage-inducible protein DinB n=1 Tax=Mucilaginibacter achroorhodeus TaxID=2599294 RepID=A0A563U3N0_9SPHI|nr:DinB family protein [Mucilaginibacter achroorhodeus]TWR25954.1 damage-inducible protein DinB [Mucilaginibacter achroorhodeus]